MRVLVVDDSAFMRRAISKMIDADPALKVVGAAANGQEGVDMVQSLKPDVVTLDIEMPVMDGLTALRKIRALPGPKPAVLMCSSLTKQGSHEALAALSAGAADVIAKDASHFSLKIEDIAGELTAKIKAIGGGRRVAPPRPAAAVAPPRLHAADFDVVLIGSSTGGPPVLETVLAALPAGFPLPVVVAQHMPPMFTKSLSERLDASCQVEVRHASAGGALEAGVVYIAEGGKHVRVLRSAAGRLGLEVSEKPADAPYKPSVNELFASGARSTGARTLAVVMTGMGDDGKKGAIELKAKGGTILAQDMDSCVVYGMPRAVNEAGLTLAALPPSGLASCLASLGGSAGATRAA